MHAAGAPVSVALSADATRGAQQICGKEPCHCGDGKGVPIGIGSSLEMGVFAFTTLMMGRIMCTEFFNNADWPMAAAITCVMVLLLLLPITLFQYNQVRQIGAGKGRP